MPYERHPKNRIHNGTHNTADLSHTNDVEDTTKDPAEASALREASTTEGGTTAALNRTRNTEAEDT